MQSKELSAGRQGLLTRSRKHMALEPASLDLVDEFAKFATPAEYAQLSSKIVDQGLF